MNPGRPKDSRTRYLDPRLLVTEFAERRAGSPSTGDLLKRIQALESQAREGPLLRKHARILTFGPLSWPNVAASSTDITGEFIVNTGSIVGATFLPVVRGTAARLTGVTLVSSQTITQGEIQLRLRRSASTIDIPGAVLNTTFSARNMVNFSWDEAIALDIPDTSFFSLRLSSSSDLLPAGTADVVAWFWIELEREY